VTAGQRLQIAVGTSPGGNPGPFEFHLLWRQVVPPSPNDAFTDRLALPAEDYEVAGNLQKATREPGEFLSGTGGSVWWRFPAPATGVLEVVGLTSDSFTTQALLFAGDSLESLGQPLEGILGPRLAWKVQAEQIYSLQVSAGGGTPGEFQLKTRFWHPPNDRFADAIVLDGPTPQLDTWMVDASLETNETVPNASLQQTLWWRWTAPAAGRLEQLWIHESLPAAAVYRGNSLTDLTPLDPIQPAPHLGNFSAVRVEPGEQYWIQYAAPPDLTVPLRNPLRFAAFGTADNDSFGSARPIEGRTIASVASTFGATREPGEPLEGASAGTGSLWWEYTAYADGLATLKNLFGSVQGVRLAVYQGRTVDALTRLVVGTDSVTLSALRGDHYFIAAEVPTNVLGDVGLQVNQLAGSFLTREPSGNLVKNFSFEDLDPTAHWTVLSGVSGVVGAPIGLPAADGNNLLTLQGGFQQTLALLPGRSYRIRVALRPTDDPNPIDLRVRFQGSEVGRLEIPAPLDHRFWHWRDFGVVASSAEAVLELSAISGWMDVDAVSVVPTDEPPRAVGGPSEALAVAGGIVTLAPGVSGSEPLTFVWYRDSQAVPNGNQRLFTLNPVGREDAGEYRARVSNAWGSVTSAPVTLRVEAGSELRFIRQPVGEDVILGQYLAMDVLASGMPPFEYQWFRNGAPLLNATGRQLIFDSVAAENLGTYEVVVRSGAQSVRSLPALLLGSPLQSGGGTTRFAVSDGSGGQLMRVTNVDGVTLLEGEPYVAQLYVGTSPETLRPMGTPAPFLTGVLAGRWRPQDLVLPQIPARAPFYAQIRAWDRTHGASYEEARALGGLFGRSVVTTAMAGNPLTPPEPITTFPPFSLMAGQPGFTAGRIESLSIESDGSATWKLTGAVGFRYLLERLSNTHWNPVEVIPNFPGTWTFKTSASSDGLILYRARVLD